MHMFYQFNTNRNLKMLLINVLPQIIVFRVLNVWTSYAIYILGPYF
ncbi:MAG: hypothetical protein A4E48_02730 [Methanosaeta sp. PtaU1.Bin060]|nr:MAG: hypothetical protein A4E48_02730 [Methanosaeta sp. PtaU1.Bin060]